MPVQQDQVVRNTGLRWVGDALVRLLICKYLARSRQILRKKSMSSPLLPSSRKIRASELHQDTKPHAQPLHSTSDLFFLWLGLRLSCVMEHGPGWFRQVKRQNGLAKQHPDIIFWWEKNVKCPKKMIEDIEASWSHWQNPLPETFCRQLHCRPCDPHHGCGCAPLAKASGHFDQQYAGSELLGSWPKLHCLDLALTYG